MYLYTILPCNTKVFLYQKQNYIGQDDKEKESDTVKIMSL